MAEETVFSKEGAASINEADASPRPAFEDMKGKLVALGVSEGAISDMVMEYCKGRSENPMGKQDAYKMAFYCVTSQWMMRLVRFGGYTVDEIPGILEESIEGLRRATDGEAGDRYKREHTHEMAVRSLSSLYYSLRVRGVSDEELKEVSLNIADKASWGAEGSHEGLRGVSGVGAAQALADNLAAISKYGLSDEELKEVGREFWEAVHAGDLSARFVWKHAFSGVFIQWMYRLSLEAGYKGRLIEVVDEAIAKLEDVQGRSAEDQAREALDTFYAYMTVSGYSDEDIQAAVADLVAAG